MKEEILKSLQLFHGDGDVVELRVLEANSYGATVAGYFNTETLDKMAEEAEELDSTEPGGIYFTVNPIQEEVHTRIYNKTKKLTKSDAVTGDSLIKYRKWLFIDCDPVRISKISSSNTQLAQARDKALEIRLKLKNLNFPDPIVAMSGNGYHLHYRLDPTITGDHDDSIYLEAIKGICDEFSDEFVKVDTTSINKARICRLYGTMVRKGSEVEEQQRFHRQSHIDWTLTPTTPVAISAENLFTLTRMVILPEELQPKDEILKVNSQSFSVEGFMEKHNLVVESVHQHSDGTSWRLAQCPFSDAHADGASIFQYKSGGISAKCYHNSCEGKTWKTLRNLLEPGWEQNKLKYNEGTLGCYGDMFVFQDRITGKFMVKDKHGIRAMLKSSIADLVYGDTGRKLGRVKSYKLDYIPEETEGEIPDLQIFNVWTPSPMQVKAKELVKGHRKPIPMFKALMDHMFPDKVEYNYMLNFLSATLHGYKLNVGIVLTDKGGTGKTLLLEYIIKTLFGNNCVKFSTKHLTDNFNNWMENKQLLFGDEIKAEAGVEDFLKDFITGNSQAIRGMRENWNEVSNRANMIIASNRNNPIYISDTDRRWNFFNPGTVNDGSSFFIDSPQWKALGDLNTTKGREMAISEAPSVGAMLYSMTPNLDLLTNALNTNGKSAVIYNNQTLLEVFLTKVSYRDTDWIYDNLMESPNVNTKHLIDDLTANSPNIIAEDLYWTYLKIDKRAEKTLSKKIFYDKVRNSDILVEDPVRKLLNNAQGESKKLKVYNLK